MPARHQFVRLETSRSERLESGFPSELPQEPACRSETSEGPNVMSGTDFPPRRGRSLDLGELCSAEGEIKPYIGLGFNNEWQSFAMLRI